MNTDSPSLSKSDVPGRLRGYVVTVVAGLVAVGAVSAVATRALVLVLGYAAVDCLKAAPPPAECVEDPLRFRTLLIGPTLLTLFGLALLAAVASAVRLVRAGAAVETALVAPPTVLLGFAAWTLVDSETHLVGYQHDDLAVGIAVALSLVAARWLAVTWHRWRTSRSTRV